MDYNKILNDSGIDLMNDIRANMSAVGMNATNETAHSLRIQIKNEGNKTRFQLLGRPYFMTVQTGRKPTPGKKPSREMIDRITAWLEARNMDIEAAWAIATKIQQRGTLLWLQGGRTDIVDPAVDDFINSVSQAVLKGNEDEVVLKVRQQWSQ